eukprot:2984543-Rhodomonas_salina.1
MGCGASSHQGQNPVPVQITNEGARVPVPEQAEEQAISVRKEGPGSVQVDTSASVVVERERPMGEIGGIMELDANGIPIVRNTDQAQVSDEEAASVVVEPERPTGEIRGVMELDANGIPVVRESGQAQVSDDEAASVVVERERPIGEIGGVMELDANGIPVARESDQAPVSDEEAGLQSSTNMTESVETQEPSSAQTVPVASVMSRSFASNEPMLRISRPIGFKQIYNDRSTGAKMDGSIWKPVAPEGEYLKWCE